MKSVAIIGYSGHAYVACEIIRAQGHSIVGYFDLTEKEHNPFDLIYLGTETNTEAIKKLDRSDSLFISIGNNSTREKIYNRLNDIVKNEITSIIHPSAIIAADVKIGNGIMIGPNVTINPLTKIGDGAICNTSCIIEHENIIGEFSHIGPGAVLCGNVHVGKGSFVGANAVIKQGVHIGDRVIVGAGSVVLSDIKNDSIVAGNPSRDIGESKT